MNRQRHTEVFRDPLRDLEALTWSLLKAAEANDIEHAGALLAERGALLERLEANPPKRDADVLRKIEETAAKARVALALSRENARQETARLQGAQRARQAWRPYTDRPTSQLNVRS